MKRYSERSQQLKEAFSLEKESQWRDSNLEVKLQSYHSKVGVEENISSDPDLLSPFSAHSDNTIAENRDFVYPIVKPRGSTKAKDVILLLHGLNERTWDKYLPWAERLARDTGKTVLMFPISFHINRSPQSWSNPRAMMPYVRERKDRLGKIPSLSFFNLALSNRLTDSPYRFYSSGKQTMIDIMHLMHQIKQGKHPLIAENAQVDIFAYSIGGFISQLLMMADTEDLFADTKLFLFCSGSVFLEMNGDSKSIMDKKAFATLQDYYRFHFQGTRNPSIPELVNDKINAAFDMMVTLKKRVEREHFFDKMRNRIQILSLKKDIVIPTTSIIKSLGDRFVHERLQEADFDFNYSHETPFPIFKNAMDDAVSQSFDYVFNKASSFLA